MEQGGVPPYPSVFVVDSHTNYPQIASRLGPARRSFSVGQKILLLLVIIALCGLVIEAGFIYRLHQQDQVKSLLALKSIQEKEDILRVAATKPNSVVPSSPKPVAHLTDGQDNEPKGQIMTWSEKAQPLLIGMEYNKGKLVIKRRGYYYVYSKIYFTQGNKFHHFVCVSSPRYLGKDYTILESRNYSKRSEQNKLNSFLGGVFLLNEGDAIFVKVDNVEKIERHGANENFFGAYMI